MTTPSLQRRLAWRLGIVLTVAMLTLSGVVTHFAWTALDDVDDASLQVQMEQILGSVAVFGGGTRLDLPAPLAQAYRESGDAFLYALLDAEGRVLQSSSVKAQSLTQLMPAHLLQQADAVFLLPDSTRQETPYLAMLSLVPGGNGHRLLVAQQQFNDDVLIDTLVTEFFEHIGWTLPFIILAALAISLWTIRSSLKPVMALSLQAARINPQTANVRLPDRDVPTEILPLVLAMNSALDRLEKGFELQRQFTANAAHELRTPLALLTARLGEMEESESVRGLSEDINRMNRLVGQLLRVSRLDAADVTVDQPVDLNVVAADVVTLLAPLAIDRHRSVALAQRAERPVMVRGSATALEDAVRNLVENGLAHTPPGTEVSVAVSADGSISVRDQGPGVPPEAQTQIFNRFWRGKGGRSEGAGLGLAIVREIAAAHSGSIEVDNAASGGAIFTLRIPLDVRLA